MHKRAIQRTEWRGWALLFLLVMACPAQAQEWTYRVRPGDTLWDVAGEYLAPSVPWQRLQEHNRVADPYQLAPGSTLRIPVQWLHRQPAHARVVAVRGDASAQPKSGNPSPVTAGMSLGSGAVVKTAPEASLSLQFADGSRLLLLGDSELRLERLTRFGRSGIADTRLKLQRGRIGNDVRHLRGPAANFIVDTPSASSAVRGTRFRVEADATGTQTEVLEGRVAVSTAARSALVQRGYGAAVSLDQTAVTPVALLAAPDLSGLVPAPQVTRAPLAWRAVAGARRYRVQISEHARFDSLQVDAEVDAPDYTLPPLEEGRYHVRVRAIDAQGLEGRDAVAQIQVDGLLPAPYSIAPAASSVVRTSDLTLAWTQAPGAAAYDYEVAGAAGWNQPVAQGRVKDASSVALAPVVPGDYAWRIRSVDRAGRTGPFGDPVAFVIRPLTEVTAIDGRAAEAGDTRQVTFRWPAGQPGQRYRFQMSRTADFREPTVDQTVGEAEITLPRLRSGTWYLRAQTIDVDGFEGPFPRPQVVEVPCRLCKIGAGAGALLILLTL